jgi:hypothetical protein
MMIMTNLPLIDTALRDMVLNSAKADAASAGRFANDNRVEPLDDLSDPLLKLVAELDVARTRLW